MRRVLAQGHTGSSTRPHPSLGLAADEVLTTTRAVRRRLDLSRPVPRPIVEDCVRIAAQAPSGRNRQRWDLVAVDDREQRVAVAEIWRKGLAESVLGVTGLTGVTRVDSAAEDERLASSAAHLASHLHEVPVLGVFYARVESRDELSSARGQASVWGSVVPAAWSFMLAARERGLGTAWTTCHLSFEEEMAEVLHLDYPHAVQAVLTPIAFTHGVDFRPGPRADHRDFVHWNHG